MSKELFQTVRDQFLKQEARKQKVDQVLPNGFPYGQVIPNTVDLDDPDQNGLLTVEVHYSGQTNIHRRVTNIEYPVTKNTVRIFDLYGRSFGYKWDKIEGFYVSRPKNGRN